MAQDNGATTDISKPIEFNSEDVDDGFQHFWLPMIFMAMPGKGIINSVLICTSLMYFVRTGISLSVTSLARLPKNSQVKFSKTKKI